MIDYQKRQLVKHGISTLLLGSALAGCSRSIPEDDLQSIRMGVPDVSPHLDPRFATDAFSMRICRLIYPALVDFDQSSLPTPWLASHWEWKSPTQLWLGIKSDIFFHHGKALTAEDVVATYQSILDPSVASPLKGPLRLLQSIEVQDAGVLLTWKQPDRLALFRLTVPILPADLLAIQHDFQHHPVGSGNCRFISLHDQKLVLARADGVKISFIGVKDATVRLLKVVRDELDIVQNDLSPELVQHARLRKGLLVDSRLGSSFSYLGINFRDTALAKREVRLAIAYAIDRHKLANSIMHQLVTPGASLFPPDHWCGLPSNRTGIVFDPDVSRALMTQAGYDLTHNRLRLVFKTSTDPTRLRLATVYQDMLKVVGIDLEIASQDFGSFYHDIRQGNFQLYGLSWIGVKSPEIFEYAFASYSTPPMGANRGFYHSVEYDALIAQALAEEHLPNMAEKYRQLQDHILEHLPMIPLWHDHQVVVARQTLKGYVLAEDGRYDSLLQVIKTTPAKTA